MNKYFIFLLSFLLCACGTRSYLEYIPDQNGSQKRCQLFIQDVISNTSLLGTSAHISFIFRKEKQMSELSVSMNSPGFFSTYLKNNGNLIFKIKKDNTMTELVFPLSNVNRKDSEITSHAFVANAMIPICVTVRLSSAVVSIPLETLKTIADSSECTVQVSTEKHMLEGALSTDTLNSIKDFINSPNYK